MIPASISTLRDGYDAARRRAAVIDRSGRGRLRLSGADRRTYLHGLLTNDIAVLEAGTGCYAAYLTPQGRMIADVWVYELGDAILLTLDRAVKDEVLEKLDQYVFAEDVQVHDLSDTFTSLAIVGPGAARVVAGVVDEIAERDLAALAEHGCLRATAAAGPVVILRVTDTGEPGYELVVEAANRGSLETAIAAHGAAAIGPEVAEALRIEAGIPRFMLDMDRETIPLEAGIEARAISMTKGCYVGQEVIVRVLHRGHGRVAEKLVGLTIEGDEVPPPGTALMLDGRTIGRVTSSVQSPALGCPIALGYVQRDAAEPGTAVTVDGARAVVTERPFVPAR